MLTRCYYKELMKENALSFFTIQYKTKLLYKERYEYRDRKYRSYDLFYFEKMKAEYLYKFYINKFRYQNTLNSNYKRTTFSFQMYSHRMELFDIFHTRLKLLK